MITLDLRRIVCAKELQDSANVAQQVIKEAMSPRLSDVSMMGEIYRHFKDFVSGVKVNRHSERKREFLFIIAYLYCPSVLVGGTMPKGFRGILKELLHVESPSAISNYTSDLFFLYNHYEDFREIVEGAYQYISGAMNLDNIIRASKEDVQSDER